MWQARIGPDWFGVTQQCRQSTVRRDEARFVAVDLAGRERHGRARHSKVSSWQARQVGPVLGKVRKSRSGGARLSKALSGRAWQARKH